MATGAFAARAGEDLTGVALIAGQLPVSGVQREARLSGVAPLHRGPRCRPMALLALDSEPRGVAVVLTSHPVAVVTGRRRSPRDAIPVAGGAGHLEMPALERESSLLVKSARGVSPLAIDLVAALAGRAELASMSILMAAGASFAEAGEAHCHSLPRWEVPFTSLMTLRAWKRGVLAPKERRLIPMSELPHLEAVRRVAARAVASDLTEVNVAMTRRALRGDAAEPHGGSSA